MAKLWNYFFRKTKSKEIDSPIVYGKTLYDITPDDRYIYMRCDFYVSKKIRIRNCQFQQCNFYESLEIEILRDCEFLDCNFKDLALHEVSNCHFKRGKIDCLYLHSKTKNDQCLENFKDIEYFKEVKLDIQMSILGAKSLSKLPVEKITARELSLEVLQQMLFLNEKTKQLALSYYRISENVYHSLQQIPNISIELAVFFIDDKFLLMLQDNKSITKLDSSECYGLFDREPPYSERQIAFDHFDNDIDNNSFRLLATSGIIKHNKNLYIVMTSIDDEGLSHIRHFENLKRIYLSKIGSQGIRKLSACKLLEALYIRHEIEHNAFVELGSLKNLELLQFKVNLVEEEVRYLLNLPKLKELHWAGGKTNSIGYLRSIKLKTLFLQVFFLRKDIESIFEITTLQKLIISCCDIKTSDFKNLPNLVNLNILSLGELDLEDSIFEYIQYLPNIKELYLWGCRLQGKNTELLGKLTNLRYLSLSYNNIGKDNFDFLKKLTHLEELDLYCSSIDDNVLEIISDNLIYLKKFKFSPSEVSDEAYIRFKEKNRTIDIDSPDSESYV